MIEAMKEIEKNKTLSTEWTQAAEKRYGGLTVSAAENVLLTGKLLTSTKLGVLTNRLAPIQDQILARMQRTTATAVEKADLAVMMQLTHQAPQAGLKAARKGGVGAGTEALADFIMGATESGSYKTTYSSAERGNLESMLRNAFKLDKESITKSASGEIIRDITAIDKTPYNKQQIIDIYGSMAGTDITDESLKRYADILENITIERRARHGTDIGDLENTLISIFTKKSGFTNAKEGRYTVEEAAKRFPQILKTIERLGVQEVYDASPFIETTMRMTNLHKDIGKSAEKIQISATRVIEEAHSEKLDSLTIDLMGMSKEKTSLFDSALDKIDDFITKSPKAKWLAGGAAAIGAIAMTARMFGGSPVLDAPGGGPAAPPAFPTSERDKSIRPVDNGETQYMSPSFGLTDRFMSSGIVADPTAAILDLKNTVLSNGNFSVDDRSMNDAQFSQQYETATSGRF